MYSLNIVKKHKSKNIKTITLVISILLNVLLALSIYMVVKDDYTSKRSDASKLCKTFYSSGKQCIGDYIGLSQEDALRRAPNKLNVKIWTIDGKFQAHTDETANIYLEIENGIVSEGYFEPRYR
jgi:hypothetical protein